MLTNISSEDQGLLSLDEATSSVDALVADDDLIPSSQNDSNQVSRSSTPSIPPGFSLPHAHPQPATREEPAPKVLSRFVPTSAPFTPSRVSILPTVATPLSTVTVPPSQSAQRPKVTVPTPQAKQDVKTLATNTGISKTVASQSSQPPPQSSDFPALDSGKAKVTVVPSINKISTPVKSGTASKRNPPILPLSAAQAPFKVTEKHPAQATSSVVSIKPVVKTLGLDTSNPTPTPAKSLPTSDYPSLPPSSTLASNTTQAPLPRPVPKTLRVVPTPKTEAPPAGSLTPSSATSMFPPILPSRKPSLASIQKFDRPGTPSSEIISDNASITSASISRANSPPPSKVGSAPVREFTKARNRKMRKEIQKEKERLEMEALASVAETKPEVEVAPILGRKKKQKKERPIHHAAGGSTPAISRPTSPGHVEPTTDEPKSKHSVVEQAPQISRKQSLIEPETNRLSSKGQDLKGKGKAKAQPVISPELTPPPAPEVEDEPNDKPVPTPATIFQELIADGSINDPTSLSLLKNPVVNHPLKIPIDPQTINQKLTISPEDRQALLAGEPVQKGADGPNRIMLTPNGDCVRNLTPEEEKRYLDLQASIAGEYGPTSFISEKHHASNGFALIGGRAVPNGPPSFFPVPCTGTPAMDPVSKIQRDEALSYINQYVLPSLSTNSQLEKALNANAIDTEIIRSGDPSAWTNWGNENSNRRSDAGADGSYGPSPVNREGVIANGLENMTAHFAIGGDLSRGQPGQPLGNVSLLSLTESEGAMQLARKETEGLEKRLTALIKKNRKLLLPSGH